MHTAFREGPRGARRFSLRLGARAKPSWRTQLLVPRSRSTVTQPSSPAALPLVVHRQHSGFSRTCVLWS